LRLLSETLLTVSLGDLNGIWKESFPKDFDIDNALREICGEWQKEMEEIAWGILRLPETPFALSFESCSTNLSWPS
jgi:hypothetical protein